MLKCMLRCMFNTHKLRENVQADICTIHKNCLFQEFSETGKTAGGLPIHPVACNMKMVSWSSRQLDGTTCIASCTFKCRTI